MNYQDEWLIYEAGDDIDEVEHRAPTEEFLFYQAVASGNVEAVKKIASRGVSWKERVSAYFLAIR